MSYDLNKYGQTLKAGTTYYYQFYVVVDGVEYKSAVKSFKTAATTSQPKLTATWSEYSTIDIMATDATIKGKVSFNKSAVHERCGFYLGTSQSSLAKAAKYDSIGATRSNTWLTYNMNKYGYKLKAGTTYYYQFYIVVNGVEYKSAVKSFKTAAAPILLTPTWSDYSVEEITKTNAIIKAKVTYGKEVALERCGFYLGTSQNSLTKASKYDAINANRKLSYLSYGMNKYGYTLNAGTTYYYQFYVVVDGIEYKSAVKTFKAAS